MKRLIFLIILTLSIIHTALAQSATGTTLATVNVRAEPAFSHNILTQIPIATTVTIQGRNGTGAWLYITANGISGWVSSSYVGLGNVTLADIAITNAMGSASTANTAPQPTIIASGDSFPVTAKTRLNIRSAPNTSGSILDTLNFDQTITAIGRSADGSWLAIDTGSVRGWVSTAYVNFVGNINGLAVQDGTIANVVTSVVSDNAPAQTPITSSGAYVITGPAPNNFSSYDVEITLHWNTTANLDLRVTGPDGYTIVPGVAPSPTGGYFQQPIGANEDCRTAEGAALEVITWDKGTAPSGLYHIEAEHVNSCFPEHEENTLFWVSFKNDGPQVEFWVYFIKPGDLFEFEFVRP